MAEGALASATFAARVRRCLVAFALAFVSGGAAQAADFQAANQLYDQGKFSEARQHYEQLVDAGQTSANLFHNLGNANYRLGATGPAMLAYERALALEPAHPEARANLALLRQQTGARLWPESWLERVFPGRRVDLYVLAAAAAVWLTVFCVVVILLRPRREQSGRWFLALAGLVVAAYAGAAVWHFGQGRALAIVIAKETEARLAPAESAGTAGTLPTGSQVRILSERGDWIYCALPGESRGWIPLTALARVIPGKT